ncbi:ethanolamine utilization protein EutH [Clostridium chauvoei]|uniref:ethanolamine utilization protein EutH n=1 Tax=Clostridium chauvoei TaxID=46867 RepID=UPI000BB86A81|nr:ethanolamine utilization protein EutH [Clostridium chauvoei]ATD56368.1 ethanolamine utilization protein EutH [Clostridium chauvoei]MBX7379802.1 ethanolamine utilization protein EutH [Clostridium chauvoei]MBX7384869.1 ethanolamine utilization protein EutH [Clostridium chauvoei]MBX7397459.1 ethanolamine utilization protein EutH [Clostridium chauvoei]MBX7399974.1 ethanolamine utilization protein EutH [Clostridium chauvoei]
MEKIVLYIVSIFFIIGVLDYILGDRFKLGRYFEEGINNMGPLALSMVGILSVTPIISELILKYIVPITNKIAIDSSIVASSFIAIDMGAFKIAENISSTQEMIYFSGVLIASILGCTISFTLPLALGMIKEKRLPILCKGILCGIVTIPVGLFIGGLMLRIDFKILLINLMPIILLSILVSVGLYIALDKVIRIFTYIGKVIITIGFIGLGLQGFTSISGIVVIKNLLPIGEALTTVGKIAIFLGGAYVMLEIVKRLLGKQLELVKEKIGINSSSIAALIGSLASAIIVFSTFEDLDDRGKVICSAFSVAGAYVLGGQLGYVATEAKEIVLIYIATKLICGVLAIMLAFLITKKNSIVIKES